ncbi:putative phage abortive infection protein [Mucilaginibacter sp.]|uniref:putative phage abortive infection protein n=1 Tax=Mucilaginibacter sp. TaxID=1882438 RepID=UPI003D0FAD8C
MINLIKQVKVIIILLICLIFIAFMVICFRFAPAEAGRLISIYNIVNSIAPVITIILIVVTFRNQQEQLATLKTQMVKSDEKNKSDVIEQRFFLFLQIHRDNVAGMSYDAKILGKGLFVKAVELFRPNFNNLDKYLDVAHTEGQFNRKLTVEEKIEVTYALLFYGTSGSEAEEILKETLEHFDEVMIDGRRRFYLFVIRLCKLLDIKEAGMQSELGNYFRHFFHTVTYIHDLKELNEEQKRFYVKRLRGQLSNYEMAILFLNSFSIGRRWRNYIRENASPNTAIDLIKEYGLIKNLPPGFLSRLHIQQYFPDMPWEGRAQAASKSNPKSVKRFLDANIVRAIREGLK